MDSWSIGLSGLKAARTGLDIVGNNVANAATEGYHRQRVDFTPAYSMQIGTLILGGGVEFGNVKRELDILLEQEIIRQESALGEVSHQLAAMRSIENAFNELTTESGGLSFAIGNFFSALNDLTAHTHEATYQQQAVSAAESMTSQFRTLAEFLTRLDDQLMLDTQNVVEEINVLTLKIAELNDKIQNLEVTGGQANNLRDQRDKYVTELSGLVDIETIERDYGVVDVTVGGIAVVSTTFSMNLEVGINDDGKLALSTEGSTNYVATAESGRLGALFSIKNTTLPAIKDSLDQLAQTIIQQMNEYHVQGISASGSFTELTGWRMSSENLSEFIQPVTDGTLYIRVTDTDTGTIERYTINIDAANDTLTSIAADITDNVTGLNAYVANSTLHIEQSATNYVFDFLPGVLPEPTENNLTGGSIPEVAISGIYTGSENQTYTCTVLGDGEVGNDDDLRIEIKNGDGEVVKTVNVGTGYAAGTLFDAGDGIVISLGQGTLNDTETFTIQALASSDTSGVLAATGINAFFYGTSADDISVCRRISDDSALIATALGSDTTHNTNIERMANLRNQTLSDLGGLTIMNYYQGLVADVGLDISLAQSRQDNVEVMLQDLLNRQATVSGVDINDEAAKMLMFQQMFGAMAKYLSMVQVLTSTMLEMF